VPNHCEIEYQLYLIERANFPPAGLFEKIRDARHPRFNQWDDLIPLEQKHEYWGNWDGAAYCDLVSAPHFTKEHQKDLLG